MGGAKKKSEEENKPKKHVRKKALGLPALKQASPPFFFVSFLLQKAGKGKGEGGKPWAVFFFFFLFFSGSSFCLFQSMTTTNKKSFPESLQKKLKTLGAGEGGGERVFNSEKVKKVKIKLTQKKIIFVIFFSIELRDSNHIL